MTTTDSLPSAEVSTKANVFFAGDPSFRIPGEPCSYNCHFG
jgi:hypothetical protein